MEQIINHKSQKPKYWLIDRFVWWSLCWSLVAFLKSDAVFDPWWWQVEVFYMWASWEQMLSLSDFHTLRSTNLQVPQNFSFRQQTNHKTIRFACIIIVTTIAVHSLTHTQRYTCTVSLTNQHREMRWAVYSEPRKYGSQMREKMLEKFCWMSKCSSLYTSRMDEWAPLLSG